MHSIRAKRHPPPLPQEQQIPHVVTSYGVHTKQGSNTLDTRSSIHILRIYGTRRGFAFACLLRRLLLTLRFVTGVRAGVNDWRWVWVRGTVAGLCVCLFTL